MASSSTERSRCYFAAALVVLIAVSVGMVFSRALGFGFLEWDDQLHLTANPFLQPDASDRYLHFWREAYGKMYMPLTYHLWALVYSLSQKPALFHGLNIAVHTMNALLVFVLLRRLVRNDLGSALGAMIFALHPLQVESVVWVSELRGLLAGMFTLAAMICHDRRWESRSPWRWDLVVTLLVGCGLLSKPSAVVAPVLMLVLDVTFRHPLRSISASLAPSVILAVTEVVLQNRLQPAHAGLMLPMSDRPTMMVDAVWFYVKKVTLPVGLCADHARTPQNVLGDNLFSAQCMRLLIIGIFVVMLRNRLVIAAVAVFIAVLLPVSGIVPFEFQLISTVADRYAYLAQLAPALLIALLVRWKTISALLILPLIIACGVLSFRQSLTWKDDTTLWTHANTVSPRSAIAECNLGQQELEAGRMSEAFNRFARGINLNPLRNNGQQGMAQICRLNGDAKGAERWYREAMKIDPIDPAPAADLLSLLATTGRVDEAIELGRQITAFAPDHANAWNNLGGAYLQKEDLSNAERSLRRAIELHPRHPQAHFGLGLVLGLKGEDATSEMSLAAQCDPSNPQPLIWLGQAAMRRSDWGRAETYFREALSHDPRNLACLNNLGQVLAAADKTDESIAVFEAALQIAPNDPALQNNLAAAKKIRELRSQDTPR